MYITKDTVVTVAINGLTIKQEYKIINDSTIKFRDFKGQLTFGNKYEWYTFHYYFEHDTLKLGPNYYTERGTLKTGPVFNLHKSKFNDYYDYIANDSTMKINLPNTSFTHYIRGEKIEIYIGIDPNQKTRIKINNTFVSDYNELIEEINKYKTEWEDSYSPIQYIWCLLFIDKSVKMGTVYDIQSILKANEIRKVLYVSKGPTHLKY